MTYFLLNLKGLFQKKWFIIFGLIFLLFFQLIYSFLFPVYGTEQNLQFISTNIPEIRQIYPLISSDYLIISTDTPSYLESAQNFSSEELGGRFTLARPLYPFLIFLTSIPFSFLSAPSLSLIFFLSILVNFILISLAVILFFFLLKNLFSLKVAWLSSVLLIFSPFVHNSIVQPLAEMLMIFAVALTAYFLYNYIKKPSIPKLIFYSLVIGVLMLGKMFFAISFFILLLAIYFKRYKEGIIFSIVHLIPLALWYLWVTQVWKINYHVMEIDYWQMGVWVFDIFRLPWQETAKVFLRAVPYFTTSLFYSFFCIPIIFSLIGLKRIVSKSKNIFYFGSIASFFLLGFLINLYAYRHTFLLFPVIYPTAILGIERVADLLRKQRSWFYPLFWILAIGLIILISNVNFYKVFNFDYFSIVHWSHWPIPSFLENIFKSISGHY